MVLRVRRVSKGNDVYRKHYKVLIEPIAEIKDKKKGTKKDKKGRKRGKRC